MWMHSSPPNDRVGRVNKVKTDLRFKSFIKEVMKQKNKKVNTKVDCEQATI